MGVFYAGCSVQNMADRDKSASIKLLIVETGSEFTWLPEKILTEIGVSVQKPNQKFVMANGQVITRDVGYAILRTDGFETVDEIVFAQPGDLNLLGSRTLEGFGAVVDPGASSWSQQGHIWPRKFHERHGSERLLII
jgi:predicted aspartyl protease